MPTLRAACSRMHMAWIYRPFSVVLAVVLTIPGALAIIYGDKVSAALSHIAADYISRAMGVALLLGGVATLYGIARGRALIEVLGLSVLAAGCGVYGIGVILGLGFGGAVAGPLALAISLAIVRRVVTLAAIAPSVGSRES